MPGKGKGKDGKGRLAAFNDLGIYRPGLAVRRRPPSRATTSDAGEQTPDGEPTEFQGETQSGGAQLSPGPTTPTTPGTDDTEVSGSVSAGGTYHLRGGGLRPLCPVPEIGGDIPKAASLVRPPLPTAGSPAAFAASSSQGPNYKAPPAALGPPLLPSVYVTGCGTVYHLKNTCGKLKCARRIFERTACDQCGSLAFNGGRNIWLVHGRYHLELHGNLTVSNTTTWAPCFECGGG